MLRLTAAAACAALLVMVESVTAAPGSLDLAFNPPVLAKASTTATVLADSRIVVVGAQVAGMAQSGVVRLLPNGALDPAFAPYSASGFPLSNAVEDDGRILINNMTTDGPPVRLLPDGLTDLGFNPVVQGGLSGITLQPDGKILLSGGYNLMANGGARRYVFRLFPDGTLDTSLPAINANVLGTAIQADGKIVIAGGFTNVNGAPRKYLARLFPDGSLDTGFNPNPARTIYSVTVLPDGKILCGGGSLPIGSIGGAIRDEVARLHPNGTVDAGFYPTTDNPGGRSIRWVPQADGKLIIVGNFTTVNGLPRDKIARLHPDGTLDTTFNSPGIHDDDAETLGVTHAVLQPDGKVIINGTFTAVGSVPRTYIARLENDAATQNLSAPDATRVQWLRGGTSPEVREVTFGLSTDGGETWSLLGSGTRIAGGWELNGLSLPVSGRLRARARTLVGDYWGGSGIVENVIMLGTAAEFQITSAVIENGNFLVSFPSETGRNYTLWQSATLEEGAWADSGLPALTGSGGTLTFTLPAPAGGRVFVRVEAGP